MTTASMVRMVRRGTPLAEAAANRRSRRGPLSLPDSSSPPATGSVMAPACQVACPWRVNMRAMVADTGQEPDPQPGSDTMPTAPGTESPTELLTPAATARPKGHRRWWYRGPFVNRKVRISVGVVVIFLFFFYVALPLLASHRTEVESLGHIHIQYVALGLILQIAALAAYTELSHAVLPPNGPHRFRLFRMNLSTLALNHVSPGGGAPGAALWYRLATQSGVSSGDSGFALATQGIGSAVVLNVLFWLGLVAFLVVHGFHPPTSQHGGQYISGSTLVTVAAALGGILMAAFGGLFFPSGTLLRSRPGGRIGPTGWSYRLPPGSVFGIRIASPRRSNGWPSGSPFSWTTDRSCTVPWGGPLPIGCSTLRPFGFLSVPSDTSSLDRKSVV